MGCGGYANSAALIAAPDVELLTLTEMVDAVWRTADAVDLPVFADGDNGHGNTTNVGRTVKQFEKAGAASVMLEDQVSPKRCGHMSSKHVVPLDEFVAKIKAAVDARTDEDLTILARTDAIAVKGLSEAIDRAHRCVEAGADWVFLEAPESLEQMSQIPGLVSVPTLANMIPAARPLSCPLLNCNRWALRRWSFPTYSPTHTPSWPRTLPPSCCAPALPPHSTTG